MSEGTCGEFTVVCGEFTVEKLLNIGDGIGDGIVDTFIGDSEPLCCCILKCRRCCCSPLLDGIDWSQSFCWKESCVVIAVDANLVGAGVNAKLLAGVRWSDFCCWASLSCFALRIKFIALSVFFSAILLIVERASSIDGVIAEWLRDLSLILIVGCGQQVQLIVKLILNCWLYFGWFVF